MSITLSDAREQSCRDWTLPIPQRDPMMLGFKSQVSEQRFLTRHAATYNAFDFQRYMISWPTLRLFSSRAAPLWAMAVAEAESRVLQEIPCCGGKLMGWMAPDCGVEAPMVAVLRSNLSRGHPQMTTPVCFIRVGW